MNHLDTILEHRSLIGANNFGWCFEYDGFGADVADDSDDHEDSYYQAKHRQVARWLQRRRGLFETTLSAFPPCARSSSFPRTAAPANQQTVSTDWRIPRNTSCTESLFPPAIPPMRTTFWFRLATRLVRPLRDLGKFNLVATVQHRRLLLLVMSNYLNQNDFHLGSLPAVIHFDIPG